MNINLSTCSRGRVCSSCGVFAEQMACEARNLVEFSHNTGYANVYHLGQHTCLPKVNTKEHDDYICAQIKKYPNLTPKNLQVQCVKEKINEGDIQGARNVSRNTQTDFVFKTSRLYSI